MRCIRSGSLAISLLVLPILSMSCASAYMRGAEPVAAPPTNATASYQVAACTDMTTQQPLPAPKIRYWLVEGGEKPVLYEQGDGEAVTMITNHWIGPDGSDTWFMWAARSYGFQWVIPQDRATGVRFVYAPGAFKSFADGDVSKVAGTAGALCTLIRD